MSFKLIRLQNRIWKAKETEMSHSELDSWVILLVVLDCKYLRWLSMISFLKTICTTLIPTFNIFTRILYFRSCVFYIKPRCFTLVWKSVGWILRSRSKCHLKSARPLFLWKAYTWFDLLLRIFQVLKLRLRQAIS